MTEVPGLLARPRRGTPRARREPVPPARNAPPPAPRWGRGREGRDGFGVSVAASALLHGALAAALVFWPDLRRPEPPQLPPPAFDIVFGAQPEARSSPEPAEGLESPPAPAAPPAPVDGPPVAPPPAPPAPVQPPLPLPQQALPLPPVPPSPVPPVQQAMPVPPPPIPPPPAPPRPPEPAPAALAERLPGTVDLFPETPLELPRRFDIPLPPPPPPPPRPQVAQRPPAPALTLPEGFQLGGRSAPPPGRPRTRGLDTTVDPRFLEGRASADPMARVTGANVGADWRGAFRRWLDQNMSYPMDAAMRGEDGRVRVVITANPDGTVRSVRMAMPSSSPSLNSGTTRPFNGARLPAFPPGADPNGVTIELTVDYVLIRGR